MGVGGLVSEENRRKDLVGSIAVLELYDIFSL